MDPDISSQSTSQSTLALVQNHRLLIVGGGLFLVLVAVGGTLILAPRSVQPEISVVELASLTQTPEGPTPTSAAVEEARVRQDTRDVTRVVTAVLSGIKDGTLPQATAYFHYSPETWQTPEAIMHTLRLEKARHSENGVYNATIVEAEIVVYETQAQVPVLHKIGGNQLLSRYDLKNTPEGWRVSQLVYDTAPDLAVVPTLKAEQEEVIQKAIFSSSPVTVTLPAGDIIELKKTLFTSLRNAAGKHEDVDMTVIAAKENYEVAFFTGTRVATVARIRAEDQGTFFHAFDIRALEEAGGGSILFYPEGTVIDRTKQEKPPGVVYEIPIKLDLKK